MTFVPEDVVNSNLPQRTDLKQIFLHDVPLLDVRAPIEFTQGAFPAAQNAPLMDDEQRHQVGIRYKESGQESAIELGHQLVRDEIKAERVRAWAEFARRHPGGALYCFRGGLRSQIAQTWLHEAGVEFPRITGGYKAMRQFLLQQLETLSADTDFILIGGLTGCGKTDVVHAINHAIDLEGLAQHRGSSFGGRVERQPSQIDFENQLAIAMLKLHDKGVSRIAVEDEAHLIGRCAIPQCFRERTASGSMVWVTGQLKDRVNRIRRDYIDNLRQDYELALGPQTGFEHYRNHLARSLHNLRKRLGMQRYAELEAKLQDALQAQEKTGKSEQHASWIEPLMTEYYDPMYTYQRAQKNLPTLFEGTLSEAIDFLKAQPPVSSRPT
ncbi:tRNA 2-selenouridine(34) synthase MnmH [Orrella marina]|uniref:tRNA 2-selenouridine synthase n=1 Tax=Orrella marina TaxID=2163011 RepID=A0A2R4XML3_9BURK|nr:tRNA 2-selenouridine(34) synthase MnmH [Orrella marina]AWB35047.1 tRNA 2-selenouridine(34) synthase MnmH [Orrella marina]